MKTIPMRQKAMSRDIHRAVVLALLTGGALSAADAPPAKEKDAGADAAKSEEPSGEAKTYRNWIELSVGGTILNGDQAAFQERSGLPKGAFGGVESFHYEQDVGTNALFKVDGRGIFDNHDYGIRLELSKTDLGFLRAGYSEFRTYYDGSGGYYPQDGLWRGGQDHEDLAVDRRGIFFEAGLRLPKFPEFTVRYAREEREGTKSSTAWGDVTTASGDVRKIAPAFWDLNETRDIFALDAKHTVGKTDFGAGFRYERQKNDDTLNLSRYPGEGAGLERRATEREGVEADLFNVHAFAESRLSERLLLTVGYAYTDLDTDLTGYRVYGTAYDPDLAQRLPDANTFQDLSGGSRMNQHVGNVNLMWTLANSLALIPSLRVEKQDLNGDSTYGSPAAPLFPTSYSVSSDRGLLDVSEALELRYAGLTNWTFYARGDWLQGSGNLDETWDNVFTGANIVNRSTDDTRSSQKYSVGATWYLLRPLTLAAGYYHKIRNNDFSHNVDNTPNLPASINRYPAYLVAQGYTVDDGNARVTWRPRKNVTLVGRYDFQLGTLDSRADLLDSVQAARVTSHMLGATASWVPLNRLYLQGRLNFTWDKTDTPVDDITQAVLDSKNDYWTGSGTIGYALSNDVDLDASYFYYRADNFVDNSAFGQPYGAGAEEQGVTATMTWRLSPRIRWLLRYGFFTSHDATSGGNNDYNSHLVYSSVQYRF